MCGTGAFAGGVLKRAASEVSRRSGGHAESGEKLKEFKIETGDLGGFSTYSEQAALEETFSQPFGEHNAEDWDSLARRAPPSVLVAPVGEGVYFDRGLQFSTRNFLAFCASKLTVAWGL